MTMRKQSRRRSQALQDPFEVKREGRVKVDIWPSFCIYRCVSIYLHLFLALHYTLLIYELDGRQHGRHDSNW